MKVVPDPHHFAGVRHGRCAAGVLKRCRRGNASAMGVAVFAGMIGVTLFSIFLTPVFCVLLRQMTGDRPLSDLVLSFEPPAHSIVQ
jgi:hypothetical protein